MFPADEKAHEKSAVPAGDAIAVIGGSVGLDVSGSDLRAGSSFDLERALLDEFGRGGEGGAWLVSALGWCGWENDFSKGLGSRAWVSERRDS